MVQDIVDGWLGQDDAHLDLRNTLRVFSIGCLFIFFITVLCTMSSLDKGKRRDGTIADLVQCECETCWRAAGEKRRGFASGKRNGQGKWVAIPDASASDDRVRGAVNFMVAFSFLELYLL
jgi:hypothetical protein